MLDGLRQLLELQTLDDELSAREGENAAIPGRRADLDEQRAGAERSLDEAREALEAAESGLRGAEGDLQDQQALREKLEGQQVQVKSNEAYTALLHEIDHAGQEISDLETRILEAMEAIDAAKAALDAAQAAGRSTAARVESETKLLDAREQELVGSIAELRQRREALSARIDAELLEQYEKIAARRWPVVVQIESEVCMGCRVDIPPQRYIELLRAERVLTCSNCHRILIHVESSSSAAK